MPGVYRFAKQVTIHPYYTNIKNYVAGVYLLIWKEVQHLLLVYSVQFSCLVVSDSLQSHGLQHARLPCPSSTIAACSNSCPLSHWCHPTISSSVVPFSSHLQSFAASVSPSISSLNQVANYWSFSPSNEYSGLISFRMDWLDLLLSKGLSRVFSNTTIQKHQFFGAQPSSQSNSRIHTWLLEKPQLWLDGPLLAK